MTDTLTENKVKVASFEDIQEIPNGISLAKEFNGGVPSFLIAFHSKIKELDAKIKELEAQISKKPTPAEFKKTIKAEDVGKEITIEIT